MAACGDLNAVNRLRECVKREFNASALEFYSAVGFKTARRYMESEL